MVRRGPRSSQGLGQAGLQPLQEMGRACLPRACVPPQHSKPSLRPAWCWGARPLGIQGVNPGAGGHGTVPLSLGPGVPWPQAHPPSHRQALHSHPIPAQRTYPTGNPEPLQLIHRVSRRACHLSLPLVPATLPGKVLLSEGQLCVCVRECTCTLTSGQWAMACLLWPEAAVLVPTRGQG